MVSGRMRAISSFLSAAVIVLATVPASAAPTTVIVRRADCATLVAHRPAPDVAYRSGVDVRGRPVVPADLDPHQLALPETTAIDITVDLFDRTGIPPQGDANFVGDVLVVVEVDADGNVSFNGQPITSEAQRQLAERLSSG